MGDALMGVVHYDGEVIARRRLDACQDHVAPRGWVGRHYRVGCIAERVALAPVERGQAFKRTSHVEAQRVGTAARLLPAALGVCPEALRPRIKWRAVEVARPDFASCLRFRHSGTDLSPAQKGRIKEAGAGQLGERFAVRGGARALAEHWKLPFEPEPGEILVDA